MAYKIVIIFYFNNVYLADVMFIIRFASPMQINSISPC